MRGRLLLAIDHSEPGQPAVDFTVGFAATSKADVQVFHVRELSNSLRVPPLESAAEARTLVDETVHRLQTAGIADEGGTSAERESHIATRIVEEASRQKCSSIVL